jgi:hypothetical protein
VRGCALQLVERRAAAFVQHGREPPPQARLERRMSRVAGPAFEQAGAEAKQVLDVRARAFPPCLACAEARSLSAVGRKLGDHRGSRIGLIDRGQ